MRPTSLKNLKKAKLNLLFNQSQITLSSSHYAKNVMYTVLYLSSSHYAKNVMYTEYCASWWPCQHQQLAYLLSSSLHSSKKFICFGSHCYSAEDRASSCDVYSASSSVDSSLSCTMHAFRASPWTASLKPPPPHVHPSWHSKVNYCLLLVFYLCWAATNLVFFLSKYLSIQA